MTHLPTPPNILPDQSANLRNLEVLQKHFPSAIEVSPDGRYTVNAAQLQMALDPAGVKVEEDGFELRWVGKREAYHTAFTPAQNILEPLQGQSKNWDTTGNLLIKGDNLSALRLLRHSYFGKVKLIYIDPPYNTQSDAFIYNDDFGVNQTQILEELGYDKDNIDYIKNIYGARTHSGWLSFMYPRLLLAKDLLRDDGVIFISIDDNEQAQLKLLCDEVFGQDNFVASFVVTRSEGGGLAKQAITSHDSLLAYAKNLDEFNPLKRPKDIRGEVVSINGEDFWIEEDWLRKEFGKYGTCPYADIETHYNEKKKKEIDAGLASGKYRLIKKNGDTFVGRLRKIAEDGSKFSTLMKHLNKNGVADLAALGMDQAFSYPKPCSLLQSVIAGATFMSKRDNDLILDFFAGSGTTGEAVMRLNAEDGGNRRFILVQIPQAIDAKKQKEAHKFVTETLGKPATIFEITAERLRRAGAKIEAEQTEKLKSKKTDGPQATLAMASQPHTPEMPVDTGFRVFEVAPDLDALIFQKPLSEATQADLAHFEAATMAATPEVQAQRQARVLHNLLLAEGLPLTTRIAEVLPSRLYQAGDVAIFLGAVSGIELADTLTALKASSTPPVYLTIYAPWIADDNFLQNIKTQAESLGYSGDKLRLRG